MSQVNKPEVGVPLLGAGALFIIAAINYHITLQVRFAASLCVDHCLSAFCTPLRPLVDAPTCNQPVHAAAAVCQNSHCCCMLAHAFR